MGLLKTSLKPKNNKHKKQSFKYQTIYSPPLIDIVFTSSPIE